MPCLLSHQLFVSLLLTISLWVNQGHAEDVKQTTQPSTSGTPTTTTSLPTLVFVEPMKNYTKLAGESLKIKCVVRGQPVVSVIKWYKNEAPLMEERGRIRIRSKTGSGDVQYSRVRFSDLEPMDTGYYKCEANNGLDTIQAETVIKVHLGNKRKGTSYWSEDDYDDDYDDHDNGLIPESFPLDLNQGHGGISGLPSHIEFQGRAPDDFHTGGHSIASPATSNVINGNLPSLKPNERAGRCQRYTGTVCRDHLGGNANVFVSQGLTLDHIEQKLQASLQVISNSPELSKECAKYAIPAICLSTLPLCDSQTQKPRKVKIVEQTLV